MCRRVICINEKKTSNESDGIEKMRRLNYETAT